MATISYAQPILSKWLFTLLVCVNMNKAEKISTF